MSSWLEYHFSVRQSIPASAAFLSGLVLTLAFISTARAQINGAPASVTSLGFGGRAFNGTPASVTSLGPRGFAPNSRVPFSSSPGLRNGHAHHRHHAEDGPPLFYAVPVPYAVDLGATDTDEDTVPSPDDNYQGGPTIFDRRGSGAASYIPPVRDVPTPHAAESPVAADASVADPDPPREPTVLIFKDGRKLEVENYAIVGQTLFDLTPGHARKVALADLDLDATRQQNDNRGITFQLPPSSQGN